MKYRLNDEVMIRDDSEYNGCSGVVEDVLRGLDNGVEYFYYYVRLHGKDVIVAVREDHLQPWSEEDVVAEWKRLTIFERGERVLVNGKWVGVVESATKTSHGVVYRVNVCGLFYEVHQDGVTEYIPTRKPDDLTDRPDEFVEFVKTLPECARDDTVVDLSPQGIATALYGDDWGPRMTMAFWDRILDSMVLTMKRRGLL